MHAENTNNEILQLIYIKSWNDGLDRKRVYLVSSNGYCLSNDKN